jgi:hypothetical protein
VKDDWERKGAVPCHDSQLKEKCHVIRHVVEEGSLDHFRGRTTFEGHKNTFEEKRKGFRKERLAEMRGTRGCSEEVMTLRAEAGGGHVT